MEEVQLCAITDAMELQVAKNVKDALELVVEKENLETKEEKQRADNLEKKLKEIFTRIPDSAQEATSNVE
jgi:hypothetical protein